MIRKEKLKKITTKNILAIGSLFWGTLYLKVYRTSEKCVIWIINHWNRSERARLVTKIISLGEGGGGRSIIQITIKIPREWRTKEWVWKEAKGKIPVVKTSGCPVIIASITTINLQEPIRGKEWHHDPYKDQSEARNDITALTRTIRGKEWHHDLFHPQ